MDTKSDERATIIHTFKVTVSSGGERTYNNGLCQVRLEIELIADKNLSPAETATLRVVDGNSEQEVPLVDSSMPVPIGTWGSSLAKNVYEFHPGGADIAVENREFLHYYVQTADFANARKTIGMRITLENNQEIFSKNISHSDGTVDLIPVAPVSPPFSAWNQDWEQTHKYTVGSNIKVTIYYLGLVLATGARQAMRTMEVAPASFASSYKWLSPNSQSGAFAATPSHRPTSSRPRICLFASPIHRGVPRGEERLATCRLCRHRVRRQRQSWALSGRGKRAGLHLHVARSVRHALPGAREHYARVRCVDTQPSLSIPVRPTMTGAHHDRHASRTGAGR